MILASLEVFAVFQGKKDLWFVKDLSYYKLLSSHYFNVIF